MASQSTAIDFGAALHEARQARRLQQQGAPGGLFKLRLGGVRRVEGIGDVSYGDGVLSPADGRRLADDLANLDGWTQLRGRRLLSLGGTPHPEGAWLTPLPPALRTLADQLAPLLRGRPDQALVNAYRPGQGISAHNDGPLYEPYVAIISLESSALFEFVGAETDLLLLVNSVVVFSGAAYEDCAHRVTDSVADGPFRPPGGAEKSGFERATEIANFEHVAKTIDASQPKPRAARRLSVTFRRLKHVARTLDETDVALLSQDDRAELDRRAAWWARSINDG